MGANIPLLPAILFYEILGFFTNNVTDTPPLVYGMSIFMYLCLFVLYIFMHRNAAVTASSFWGSRFYPVYGFSRHRASVTNIEITLKYSILYGFSVEKNIFEINQTLFANVILWGYYVLYIGKMFFANTFPVFFNNEFLYNLHVHCSMHVKWEALQNSISMPIIHSF